MNPDPDRDVEQLLIEAAELSRAATDLNGVAGAAPVTGVDGSGQVEVRVAADGSPDQILVRAGWQRNLEPSRLGAAVIEAAEDAARTASRRRSSALEGIGWLDRVADLDARLLGVSAGGADPGRLDGFVFGDLLGGGQVRDINEVAEMVIKALESAAMFSERVVTGLQHPPGGEGVDDSRQVQVTIVAGQMAGCRVDQGWAAGRDGDALGAALTQAARRATEALPPIRVPDRGATDALIADVLTTLRYDSGQQATPGATGLSGQELHR